MHGEMALLAKLLYGTGMRLVEGLPLRVKDVTLIDWCWDARCTGGQVP